MKTTPTVDYASLKRGGLSAFLVSFLAVTGLFLLLPLAQWVDAEPLAIALDPDAIHDKMPDLPPEPVVEPEPEVKDEPIDELEEVVPPPTITQIEHLLNEGIGNIHYGPGNFLDFSNPDIEIYIPTEGEVDELPVAEHTFQPSVAGLLRQIAEARVVVEFICDAEGKVRNPVIISSTHREFEQPVLRALRQWTFRPARQKGQIVPVRVRLPFNFKGH